MSNNVNASGELTLGQLAAVFKKSLKRALIYVLVSVIIAATLLVTIKAFTDVKSYSTTVAFATTGSDTLSSMNSRKANMVSRALTDSNRSLDISNDIINNLTVTAFVPSELKNDESYVPTSFIIAIKPEASLKLSDKEYNSILGNIAKQYVNAFSKNALPSLAFNYNVSSEIDNLEYMQVSVDLSDYVSSFITMLNSYVSSNTSIKDFRELESGKTVEDILNTLYTNANALNDLNNTIVLNNIEKETDNLKNYLELAKANADSEYIQYNTMLTDAQTAFEKYSETLAAIEQKETGSSTFITYDASLYEELWEQVKSVSAKAALAKGSSEKFAAYITKVAATVCTAAEKTYASSKLTDLSGSISSIIADYAKIASAYNDNQYLTSNATVASPARVVKENILSVSVLLIALVAVALIAYVTAFSQTYTFMKKNSLFDAPVA